MEIEQQTTNAQFENIRTLPYVRKLYVENCDRKVAGNLSSNYQTLISLFNLLNRKFYYKNEIVNVFLEKMLGTIDAKLQQHIDTVVKSICKSH